MTDCQSRMTLGSCALAPAAGRTRFGETAGARPHRGSPATSVTLTSARRATAPCARTGAARARTRRPGATRSSQAIASIALVLQLLTLQGCVTYRPGSLEEAAFHERIESGFEDEVRVSTAALSRKESEVLFGVPIARNGIQPVWIEISNADQRRYLFFQQTVDPQYFSPREAAYKSHYSPGKRFLAYGAFGVLIWPLLLVAPVQYFSARHANTKMDALFAERSLGNRIVDPGDEVSGFVFTHLDEGTKKIRVKLLSPGAAKQFSLFVQVPGLRVDHTRTRFDELYGPDGVTDLKAASLPEELAALPCCTSNARGSRNGDPINLAMWEPSSSCWKSSRVQVGTKPR